MDRIGDLMQQLPSLMFSELSDGISLTGLVHEDVPIFLRHHGCSKTARHCAMVAAEARRVAEYVGENAEQAEIAGWLHDCSAIFPTADRVSVARQWGVPLLLEEEQLPMIIHQKLSRILGAEVFGVRDALILDAVECHTTLRVNATRLDKVLFVADKIAWDQEGIAPYHHKLLTALEQSLDHAVFVYLKYLWGRRHSLKVLHPWAREAYLQMSSVEWNKR
jgi:predicted HD superfamily hydrolase involved in NAD metabolism